MRAPRPALEDIPLLADDVLVAQRPLIEELAAALDERGYRDILRIPTHTNRLALPREPLTLLRALRGDELLFATSAFPALYRALLSRAAAVLFPLFFEGQPTPAARVTTALGEDLVGRLIEARILFRVDDELVSVLRYTPSERSCLVSDRLHHRSTGVEPVWLGADSFDLTRHVRREIGERRYRRGLDLCCGSGIQSFTMRAWTDEVTGVDLNPRAITMAGINTGLQRLDNVFFRCGDLWKGLEGRFDLILSNAPFVAMPEESRSGNLDAHGGEFGLDLTDRICAALPEILEPGGRAYMLTTSPVVAGEDLLVGRMKKLADAQAFDVVLTGYHYAMPEEYAEHHVRHGIERVVNYVTRIENAGRSGFRRVPIPPLRALVSANRVRLATRRARSRLAAR